MPPASAAPVRRNYSRWRAGVLILIHVLIGVHIATWLVHGRTLAPLEFNEVMHTLELGIVTAGFLFMSSAVLATAVFGRFFCSWGCHILALQDLCAWLLGKLRIRPPRGIRSRALLWVPAVAAVYMFAWPQVVRLWEGRGLPRLHLASDADGWASFVTQDFWRNLPGPVVALLTFAVCGFVIVVVLGSRGFCTYGCPYGAVFRLADRLAVGRIRSNADCTQCGACTAACSSHVRVHEELSRYGMVVDPACLKDLDCVTACPRGSVHFGYGRPALAARVLRPVAVRKTYEFAWWEELVMAAVFLIVLVVYRGLYDHLPFLMCIGLGVIAAYLAIVAVRLAGPVEAVRMNRWVLKAGGRVNGSGWVFAGMMVLLGALTVHSGLMRYHTHEGRRYFHLAAAAGAAGPDQRTAPARRAVEHLRRAEALGLLAMPRNERLLAELHWMLQDWQAAAAALQRLAERGALDVDGSLKLADCLQRQGRREETVRHYQELLQLAPGEAVVHYRLAGHLFESGDQAGAEHHLREAVRLRPDYAEAHCELGGILAAAGNLAAALEHLRRAVDLRPDYADGHYNLAVVFGMAGRFTEACAAIERALTLQPTDAKTAAFQAHLQGLGACRAR